MKTAGLLTAILFVACASFAWAGPPFVTDDPEPVELHHWEVYISSITQIGPTASTGTMPHLEVNNGIAPNVQLHLIVPYAYNRPSAEPTARGLGDTELGVKWRFAQEGPHRPMLGIFPLIEAPTGDVDRGLGTGHFQLFLPLWAQKSWGKWTSYGGGGYFINPGQGNRSYSLIGWLVQKDLSKQWTLGGEIFHTSPTTQDSPSELNFNLGGQFNIDDIRHVLFSAGRSIDGDIRFMSYLGFQWTFPKG